MNGINYIKAWLIFFVVSTIGGFMAAFLVGGILGLVFAILGLEIQTYEALFGLVGFCVGMILSYFVYKWSVNKFILEPIAKDVEPVAGGDATR